MCGKEILSHCLCLGRLFSRRRERLSHSSTIQFTAGAMTWSVSIIMRHSKVSLSVTEREPIHKLNMLCSIFVISLQSWAQWLLVSCSTCPQSCVKVVVSFLVAPPFLRGAWRLLGCHSVSCSWCADLCGRQQGGPGSHAYPSPPCTMAVLWLLMFFHMWTMCWLL